MILLVGYILYGPYPSYVSFVGSAGYGLIISNKGRKVITSSR